MASVITNEMRKRLLNLLKSDIDNSINNNYYIGFARSDTSGTIIEPDSLYSQNQARHTLQGVKRLSNASFVIPTVEWSIGKIYEPWSDQNFDQTNFYVVNPTTNEVFICVAQGKNAEGIVQSTGIEAPTAAAANNEVFISIDQNGNVVFETPTVSSTTNDYVKTFQTSDGYLWRYMYKISNLDYATYRSNGFIPVKSVTGITSIPEEVEQYGFQLNSVAGEIVRIEFDSAGSFTSGVPSITIDGNGSDASFSAILDNGRLVDIRVDSDGSGGYLHGSGYDYVDATLSYGNVNLRPVLSPRGGLNANPINTLKSRSLMFQLDVQADEDGTLLVENDFSQVVLFEGLKKNGSDSDFQSNTGIAMRGWTVTGTDQLTEDEIVVGVTSSARAKVFTHTVGDKLYYFQDEETGFKSFQLGEVIEGQLATGNATIVSNINPSVDAYSGDILYINNVTSVARSNDQTEDIRIVIQLG